MWYILSSVYELMPQFWNYVLLSLLVISGVVHVRRITISHQKVCPKNWKRKSKSFFGGNCITISLCGVGDVIGIDRGIYRVQCVLMRCIQDLENSVLV